MSTRPTNYAYYCSGHGYGHATRVSALASHLLQLTPKPTVTIVSQAPSHVFADSVRMGAKYRNAAVDPVISQPLAYRVDRKKSLKVLKAFMRNRETLIGEEVAWLKKNDITCVLSDAVAIACAAANRACLPSALITNFSFDSIFSYLSSLYIDKPNTEPPQLPSLSPLPDALILEPDEPLGREELGPLADQIAQDLRCADLLLRLPGYLPFPSFSPVNPLPSPDWIDIETQRFYPAVLAKLNQSISELPMYDSVPFPEGGPSKPLPRMMKDAPLLVRHPCADVYSPEARQRILDTAGVPREFQDPTKTKVCVVSFGGQVIKRPSHSRNGSRNMSTSTTPMARPTDSGLPTPPKMDLELLLPPPTTEHSLPGNATPSNEVVVVEPAPLPRSIRPETPPELKMEHLRTSLKDLPKIASPTHIFIPGAPPASNPTSPLVAKRFDFLSVPGSIPHNLNDSIEEILEEEPRILPDGWIAIVCGVAKNWGEEDLPEGFFVAPRDMWMPDLTAVGDVLLGKLGYGTCAECVDACTPFVYVPRPLIVEEHGLRRLMEDSGVGVLLPQSEYELGNWAGKIEEAYEKGKDIKAAKRRSGWDDTRKRQADVMAKDLDGWVEEWWEKVDNTDHGPSTGAGKAVRERTSGGFASSVGPAMASLGYAVEPISV
ncbi:hypothetical protein FRB94_004322 [Tulasnella sp. JGI-2019a]|nr:hypothetical protein FRB94_004322 [Tulasnella sp. JGI-2019a]